MKIVMAMEIAQLKAPVKLHTPVPDQSRRRLLDAHASLLWSLHCEVSFNHNMMAP